MTKPDAYPAPESSEPEDFAGIAIELDRLPPELDTPDACPRPWKDVLSYVHLETFGWELEEGGDSGESLQIAFLRTAAIGESKYWVWSVQDADATWENGILVVEQRPNGTITGIDSSFGLTPEQYLWMTYHEDNS
jgi:hypothetical protein